MPRESKEKWTKIITEWYPRNSKRNNGRQIKKWEDDFEKMAGPVWVRMARGKRGYLWRRPLSIDNLLQTKIHLPMIKMKRKRKEMLVSRHIM